MPSIEPWSIAGIGGLPQLVSQPCICSISGACAALISLASSITRASTSSLASRMSAISTA
jgi:hypothetical protein